MKYQGITYLKDGEREWTREELKRWKENKCLDGDHLFDEVWSVDSHYLYCDACHYCLSIEQHLGIIKSKDIKDE